MGDLDRVRGVRQVEVNRGLRVDVTLEPDEFADLNNLLRRVEARVRRQLEG